MKRFAFIFAAAALSAGAAMADPIFGTWKTAPDENGNFGHVVVAPCADKICATLAKSFDSSGQSLATKNTGRKLMWDMSPAGDGKYDGGRVYSPARGKEYKGKAVLTGNTLDIYGCPAICIKGSVWTRL